MRLVNMFALLAALFCSTDAVVCSAAESSNGQQQTSLKASPASNTVAAAASPSNVATLGAPAAAKFGLKTTVPGASGANQSGRSAEVKRIIDAYQNYVLKYADDLVRAKTPDDMATLAKHTPSPRALRSFTRLLATLVAADPKDAPSFDALMFLSKYVGIPEVDAAMELPNAIAGSPPIKIQPIALLLEHHSNNAKLVDLIKVLPAGESTDTFLKALFEKTHNPEVRAASGIRLANSLLQHERSKEAEPILETMANDRYLDGIPITARPTGPTAREWAERKLKEMRLLGVGQMLPEVSGEKLQGGTGKISDYRGKILVLDVWATWCGPCCAMIPHEVEMAKKFKDKPFAILSVSCDDDKETLAQFIEKTPMPWDHWWVGTDSEFTKALSISAYPTIFVLDGKGMIRFKNVRDEKLEETVQKLLDENK